MIIALLRLVAGSSTLVAAARHCMQQVGVGRSRSVVAAGRPQPVEGAGTWQPEGVVGRPQPVEAADSRPLVVVVWHMVPERSKCPLMGASEP